ncbi:hypothetical protein A3750_09470 [Oleiphilus sp. HI0079]|uniref:fasciclin domain-containing protein n=2 Tax=Oleiphilus sp. HI0079 TaxID=1822254 RepID=UPI0007C2BFD1|nr:fasciclin domain-containing protein [Oleiphilus sp. HI0079]KZZ17430.1 hypothetical protein A3750_09470 [Oleiphilus sp. HI0079]
MSLLSAKAKLKRWAPALVLGAIPFITACSDNDNPAPAQNIVELVQSNDDFDTLEQLVVDNGLAGTLASDGPFTVFAPTDEAFAAVSSVLSTLTPAQVVEVLQYHVLAGEVLATAAIDIAGGSGDKTVATVNGADSKIALSLTGSDLYVNTSRVTSPNILATNGVVHVIDKVLIPPSLTEDRSNESITVEAIAIANPDTQTLEDAYVAVGLTGALASTGPFTVFAPNNSAFADLLAAQNATDLNDLVTKLGGAAAVAEIIKQHVVPGAAIDSLSAYAANGGQVDTLRMNTALPVTIEDGVLKVAGSSVIATDVYGSNGVIHIIDTVIASGTIDTTP